MSGPDVGANTGAGALTEVGTDCASAMSCPAINASAMPILSGPTVSCPSSANSLNFFLMKVVAQDLLDSGSVDLVRVGAID